MVLLKGSCVVLADDCYFVVDFFEAAAVSDHNLGCHVGVVLSDDYGVVEFVLSWVCHHAELYLLFVGHFLFLSGVFVAEPAVD